MKFEDNTLEATYESKNFITRLYFRLKINSAIKLARLRKGDVILDFGCGGGWLERKLKGFEIHGYDINPEKTFIDDYKKVRPTKIFVLDVLEHVPENEIQGILDSFKNLNNRFDLIVSIPTENWISRKMRKLVGKKEVPDEHITKYDTILRILKRNFRLKGQVNFFTVSKNFLFEFNQ